MTDGRRAPLRVAVALFGLLLTAAVLLGGTTPAAVAGVRTLAGSRTPPGATPTAPAPVQVTLASVSPSMLTPTATLQVKATIRNTSGTPLSGVYVRLRYRYDTLATRVDLQKWASGDAALIDGANEPPKARLTFKAPLAPRRSVPVTLTVPASALGLTQTAAAFGPRGLAVEVYNDVPHNRPQRIGAAYTFVVWDPSPSQQPTRVTVLVPVTSTTAQGDASEPTSAQIGAMASSGRLGRLISTVQGTGASWAIDPALFAAADRARLPGATTSPAPSTGTSPNGGTSTSSTSTSSTSTSGTSATSGSSTSASGTGAPSGGWANSGRTTGATSPAPATGTRASSTGSAPVAVGGATTATTPPTGQTTTGQTTTGQGGTGQGGTGQGGTAGGATPTATAAAWLDEVRGVASTNPPLILPFGDPDLTALAHHDGAGLLGIARSLGDTAAREILGATPRSSFAWPYDGRADDATARMLTGSSWQGLVLAAGTQPPTSALNYTPTGRSSVPRAGTPLQGLLYDEGLSALLGRLGTAGVTAAEATLLQQRLLAELATITAERPEAPRHLLVTAPRNWDPDPGLVRQVFDALNQVPWVQLQSTDALIGERPVVGLSAGLVYPRRLSATELPPQDVQWALDRAHQLDTFTPVLTSPQLLVPDLQRGIVSMVGVAWRGHRGEERVAARNPLQSRLNTLRASVSVLPGSTANLLSHSGQLPVTVRNQLDQPVRVQLVLKPHSGLLLVGRAKPFTIGAHSSHTSRIPVRAVGNGEVEVVASLWASPKVGTEPVSQAPPLLVRIHSNWETIGLSIAAGLLGLLLVVGLVRSIRRGRKQLPPESAPDLDEVLVRQESGRRLPAVLRLLLGRDDTGDEAPSAPSTDADPSNGRSADAPGPASDLPGPASPATGEDWFAPRVPSTNGTATNGTGTGIPSGHPGAGPTIDAPVSDPRDTDSQDTDSQDTDSRVTDAPDRPIRRRP